MMQLIYVLWVREIKETYDYCSFKEMSFLNEKHCNAVPQLVLSSYIYSVSQEERTKLREGVPYVKL